MTPQVRRLKKSIVEQRIWITDCEANGVSYADGLRGQKIRAADESHLRGLEAELEMFPDTHKAQDIKGDRHDELCLFAGYLVAHLRQAHPDFDMGGATFDDLGDAVQKFLLDFPRE